MVEAICSRLDFNVGAFAAALTCYLVAAIFEPRYFTRWQILAFSVGGDSGLQAIRLNCHSDGVTLVPQIRKPFDVLAEGLVSRISRGDKI